VDASAEHAVGQLEQQEPFAQARRERPQRAGVTRWQAVAASTPAKPGRSPLSV